MNSLVRFVQDKAQRDTSKLFWGRVLQDADPYPFQGPRPIVANEDEYDDKTYTARYFACNSFDIFTEEGRLAYQEVMDRIAAKWYDLVFIERFCGEDKKFHYVEWIANYKEAKGTGAVATAVPQN